MLKKGRSGGGRNRRCHLHHCGLHLLLLLPCAQAQHAKGQVLCKFAQQFLFVGTDLKDLRRIQVQDAEGARAVIQGQTHHAVETARKQALCQVRIGGRLQHVAHHHGLASAHRLARGPLAVGVVLVPGQRQTLQITAVGARMGHAVNRFALVVACQADPGHAVTAHFDGDAAHRLQQFGFRRGPDDGLIALAQQMARPRHASDFALRRQPFGDVDGHGLARRHSIELCRTGGNFDVDQAPALAPVLQDKAADASAAVHACQCLPMHFVRAGWPEVRQSHAQQFLAAVAIDLHHGFVGGQQRQAVVQRKHPHRLWMGLKQGLVLLLRSKQQRRHFALLQERAQRFAQNQKVRQVALGKNPRKA